MARWSVGLLLMTKDLQRWNKNAKVEENRILVRLEATAGKIFWLRVGED